MRDEAMQMQRALDAETVDVEKHGVRVRITLAQRVVSVESNGKSDSDIAEAMNEAIKESQKQAAKKMQGMVGLEGLRGMFGGGGG